ncbi:hypothetical protein [Aliiroseovarius lamellibrachiae]|uniref:hypothetical protein n=1 Tax=Aliiroseovarius lamellibrachiae TaxID=1924933 RepID=UPI001BE124AF|nr:hypothetical protein [Aliiroseovarius lamellibrachiae]MBT2131639.1 hypothetical protein [Aliiroseovarius lamellibrachiae]
MTAQGHPIALDDLLLRVGKLNYAWTNTESLLIHLLAGLCGTDKETATVIFLTLNTSRARLDLVERLAKMDRRGRDEHVRILEVTAKIKKLGGLRNRFNHCIYAFDPDGGNPRTILMRIADRKHDIRMGQTNEIDETVLSDIESAIGTLSQINRDIWEMVQDFHYPT